MLCNRRHHEYSAFASKPLKAMTMQRLITDFLQAPTKTGETRSRKTGLIYRDALEGVLLPYCGRAGVNEPSQLTDRHMKELTDGLLDGTGSRSGRPLAKATVHSYVRAINTFLAWVKDSGEEIGARAQRPRLERRILDVLTRREIEAMEVTAQTDRNKLIVRVLADTGIRLGELLKLTAADILTEGRRHFLRVHGKGSRDRKVPLSPALAQRLKRYMALDRLTRSDGGAGRVFLGSRAAAGMGMERPRPVTPSEVEEATRRLGREVTAAELARRRAGLVRGRDGVRAVLTESGVQQMIRLLALDAGITKRVYPHLFRHSFITWQLESGLNPILLSRIVGHESLTMINQVYAHVTMDSAYDALMKALLAE
jgi:integrase